MAQKLGRRWIAADINKGAIQTTAKRLQGIIQEQLENARDKKQELPGMEAGDAAPAPAQLSFAVYRSTTTTCRSSTTKPSTWPASSWGSPAPRPMPSLMARSASGWLRSSPSTIRSPRSTWKRSKENWETALRKNEMYWSFATGASWRFSHGWRIGIATENGQTFRTKSRSQTCAPIPNMAALWSMSRPWPR